MDQLPDITIDTTKAAVRKASSTVKSAGSLIAKQAERTTLVKVTLPRLYAELGKAAYGNNRFKEEFVEIFHAIGNMLSERKAISDVAAAQPAGSSFAEKAKKLAADATDLAKTKAIDVRLYHAYVKLGEAVYHKYGAEAGGVKLVDPLVTALQKRDELDKALNAIGVESQGSWITPKRLVWAVGIFMGVCVAFALVDEIAGGGRRVFSPEIKSDLSKERAEYVSAYKKGFKAGIDLAQQEATTISAKAGRKGVRHFLQLHPGVEKDLRDQHMNYAMEFAGELKQAVEIRGQLATRGVIKGLNDDPTLVAAETRYWFALGRSHAFDQIIDSLKADKK